MKMTVFLISVLLFSKSVFIICILLIHDGSVWFAPVTEPDRCRWTRVLSYTRTASATLAAALYSYALSSLFQRTAVWCISGVEMWSGLEEDREILCVFLLVSPGSLAARRTQKSACGEACWGRSAPSMHSSRLLGTCTQPPTPEVKRQPSDNTTGTLLIFNHIR